MIYLRMLSIVKVCAIIMHVFHEISIGTADS